MRYQALTGFNIGVHEGYAKAELNNRYDKYAVGVYREGDHKLMGYVRREQNRELYEFMLNNNCIAKAKFRIWIHQGEIYGAAYIKEEWKSSLGFKSDIKI
ncbi:HIRAN domain protein [Bacteroides fragilis str. S36L5]|nr:HIRAN domain protein [Bacteroides fragilis str. S36L5]